MLRLVLSAKRQTALEGTSPGPFLAAEGRNALQVFAQPGLFLWGRADFSCIDPQMAVAALKG